MNDKFFQNRLAWSMPRFFLLLILFVFMSTGCNHEQNFVSGASITQETWLNMNIKFNSGCSQGSKDSVIHSIENYLWDTLNAIKSGDPHFNPVISVSNSPLATQKGAGTIHTNIRIYYAADTIKPPCTCSNGCKICHTLSFPGGDTTVVNAHCVDSLQVLNN